MPYTDYPILPLGDKLGEKAPIRPVRVLSYDGDKYCKAEIKGQIFELKIGYVYKTPGRCGEAESIQPDEFLVGYEEYQRIRPYQEI
jgi:hypothetical protein